MRHDSNTKILKYATLFLTLLLVIPGFPEPTIATEVDPFTEKWGIDLLDYPGVQNNFCTNVMPVTADVIGDNWNEIFLSLGYVHSISDEGAVFCLDGHTGEVLWSYFSDNFGSHTCLELYDVDSDGKLELLATGYHHVVMFNAEDGSILWEFTRPNHRQDKPAVILEEDDVVYVFTASHRGTINGIGLQKRLGATGELVNEVNGPLHPCHGGLSCEDLDGDGEFELIITDRNFGSGYRGVQCYDTDLNLLWSQSSVMCSSHLANIVDVNNDEIFDVVVMNQGYGSAGICVVDGSTGEPMAGKWSYNLGLYAHYTPAVYDIDKDGHLELITTADVGGSPPVSVWDLETWSLDAQLRRQDGYELSKPPQIANVIGDDSMEMIFVTHAGFEVFDGNYNCVAYQDDGYDGRSDRMVIQDIDNDGLNEIVAIMHVPYTGSTYTFIQCLDTPGAAPDPGARTDNFLYSLRRNGVSMYVAPPDEQESSNQVPLSVDDAYDTDEDVELNIDAPGVLVNDIDSDGPEDLTVELMSDVSDGSLSLNSDGSFIYLPDLDFVGDDSFSYRAWDGGDYSNVATVILTVNADSVNSSFGYTIEGSSMTNIENRICGAWGKAIGGNGTADFIMACVKAEEGYGTYIGHVTAGLYTYVDGDSVFAGDLIAQTEVKEITVLEGTTSWIQLNFTDIKPTIENNTKYYCFASADLAPGNLQIMATLEEGYGLFKIT